MAQPIMRVGARLLINKLNQVVGLQVGLALAADAERLRARAFVDLNALKNANGQH